MVAALRGSWGQGERLQQWRQRRRSGGGAATVQGVLHNDTCATRRSGEDRQHASRSVEAPKLSLHRLLHLGKGFQWPVDL